MARSQEIQVRAGEATLAGTLLLPDDAPPAGRHGRYPNVLLLPSWLPRTRDGDWDRIAHAAWFGGPDTPGGLLARLAQALAERGVASLRCDPRGCAGSDGAWEAVSLFTRIDDARDMIGAMRSRAELDLRRCGLVGHGEGATLALAVAIGDPAVSALTLVGASARSLRDVMRRGVAARARSRRDLQHPIVRSLDRSGEEIIESAERREGSRQVHVSGVGHIRLELAAVEQAIHTPPVALASMLHRSVTLVHGVDDVWVDPAESALLRAALAEGGNDPSLRLVEGAGHDLGEAPDALIGVLSADLAARLQPMELPPVLLALEEMGDGVR